MSPKRVVSVYYSATGRTKKIVDPIGKMISEYFGCEYVDTDVTPPKKRENVIELSKDDILILGSSTYRGKLPIPIGKDLRRILKGNGGYAVAVTSFGNRAFENVLAEMCSILKENGFVPVGAGAFAAEHVYSDKVGTGRPDADDQKEVDDFAKKLLPILKDGPKGELTVPGDPDAACYQPKGADGNAVDFHDAKPVTDITECDRCGLCVKLCPFGSIDDDMVTVSGACLKCHACIHGCPKGAKRFIDEKFLSHVGDLEKNQRERKRNAVFY